MSRRRVLDRKGQALVEHALLVAGIALISAAAVSVLGYKTSGLIAAVAAVMPGAESSSNGPISSGHLIETTSGTTLTGISLDVVTINTDSGTPRLGTNVMGIDTAGQFGKLVLDNTP